MRELADGIMYKNAEKANSALVQTRKYWNGKYAEDPAQFTAGGSPEKLYQAAGDGLPFDKSYGLFKDFVKGKDETTTLQILDDLGKRARTLEESPERIGKFQAWKLREIQQKAAEDFYGRKYELMGKFNQWDIDGANYDRFMDSGADWDRWKKLNSTLKNSRDLATEERWP
jgi:hypothetical protein